MRGRIVAVAEPDAGRREAFVRAHPISRQAAFADASQLLEGPRRGEFAVIATPDAHHAEPALRAMERGYHVLLEKPMALTEADCWRNVAASAPMILTKSCHDLDLLYWIAGSEPRRLSSLARPTELRVENAPERAPEYCADGCPHASECPYDAVAMYHSLSPLLLDLELTERPRWARPLFGGYRRARGRLARLPGLSRLGTWSGWPVSAVSADPSPAALEHALRTSRYGRCVYRVGDNDQVSSQTVGIQFTSGALASFALHSTSYREGRETRVDGTRGSAVARFYQLEQSLTVIDHKTGRRRERRFPASLAPHGGGDARLFTSFLAAVRGDAAPATTAAESLQSHRMAFAADRAQRESRVIELSDRQPGGEPSATDLAQR